MPATGNILKRWRAWRPAGWIANDNELADMVYVPGFGWIESQGPNHVEYAEDMYENGNKIGIMG